MTGFIALRDFEKGREKFREGDVLPARASRWPHLRELQRKGWISRHKQEILPPPTEKPALTTSHTAASAKVNHKRRRRKG